MSWRGGCGDDDGGGDYGEGTQTQKMNYNKDCCDVETFHIERKREERGVFS